MADLPKQDVNSTDRNSDATSGPVAAPVEQANNRRRQLLMAMKGVAIAGPIVLTLGNTPVLAGHRNGGGKKPGKASCLSANISGHDHKDAYDYACRKYRNYY